MSATTLFGFLGCALLCLASIATAFRLDRFPARVRQAAAVIAVAALLVPVGGLPAVAYVRGVTGDLSVPTLVLAASACASRIAGRTLFAPREWSALLRAVAAAALFLYPFALGWTPFDPYALGFGSIAFTTVLLLAILAAWRAGLDLPVWVVLAAALAWLAGLYESRNLWDYLIDPLAALYALFRLGPGAIERTFQRRQA
jgi:hypothetical protein